MKKIIFGAVILASLAAAQPAWAAANCQILVGKWTNDLARPSTLEIKTIDVQTGRIDGTYSSPSGTSGETFPVIGWMNLDTSTPPAPDVVPALSFSVRWGPYGSITAWSGTCRDVAGKPTIKTVWELSRSGGKFEWDHMLVGSDVFTPVP